MKLHYFAICFLVAGFLIINVAHSQSYDEQIGVTFLDNYTSLAYFVTAVPQSEQGGNGPSYLLNGYSNTGYWYQAGISYNFFNYPSPAGFTAELECWSPQVQLLVNNATSTMPIYSGDKVLISMYFNRSKVDMFIEDISTNSITSTICDTGGGTHFVSSGRIATGGNNYTFEFTGLMTEWYHLEPFYGDIEKATYTPYNSSSLSHVPVLLWASELYCSTLPCVGEKTSLFYNSTSSPVRASSSYTFSTEGASETLYGNGTFTTGTLAPLFSTSTTISTSSSTSSTSTMKQSKATTMRSSAATTAYAAGAAAWPDKEIYAFVIVIFVILLILYLARRFVNNDHFK